MAKRSNELLAVWMIGFAVVFVGMLIWVIVAESAIAWILLAAAAAALLVSGYVGWSRRTDTSNIPAPAAPIDDGCYRVLVVVDDGATSPAFRDKLLEAATGKPMKAFVVAPALASKLDRWTSDQGAYDNAEGQLQATLQELDAIGIDAKGKVGSHDPLQATIDSLREFPADAIVLATHAGGTANWLEERLVEAVGGVTRVPVSHVVVD